MKFYFVFSKRNLAVMLAAAIIALLLIYGFLSVSTGGIDGSTNAKRVAFIETLGINVDETAAGVKNITIPENFSDVYENYNSLQQQAGFNLKNYKGKSAAVYTYTFFGDDETAVHLIVSEDKIIGGDIAQLRLDGEMKPLIRTDE